MQGNIQEEWRFLKSTVRFRWRQGHSALMLNKINNWNNWSDITFEVKSVCYIGAVQTFPFITLKIFGRHSHLSSRHYLSLNVDSGPLPAFTVSWICTCFVSLSRLLSFTHVTYVSPRGVSYVKSMFHDVTSSFNQFVAAVNTSSSFLKMASSIWGGESFLHLQTRVALWGRSAL